MATIKMVNLREEARGSRLAHRVVEDDPSVTAVAWWAGGEDTEPRLLVGYRHYREGPRMAVERLGGALAALGAEAPDYLDIGAVPAEDPRLLALAAHPWKTDAMDSSGLSGRSVDVWSRAGGAGQALVYFLKVGDEVRVPLPAAVPQAA